MARLVILFGRRFSCGLMLALAVVLATNGCRHHDKDGQEARIARAFSTGREALAAGQITRFLDCVPSNVGTYLEDINNSSRTNGPAAQVRTASPGVDLLLRTALKRKVPPDVRAHLTLASLLQSIFDRRLINPRDVAALSIGRIRVNGDHASAELYFRDTLTALRIPFVQQDGVWKIDFLALLPYAEVLMRVDRAITAQTQERQVDQLVDHLPLL